jgi:hypothetical protein
MTQSTNSRQGLRREHPLFFWGVLTIAAIFLAGAVAVGSRVPKYRAETAAFNAQLTDAQKATRDSLLANQERRTQLAVAVLRRDMRIRSLETSQRHLAIILEDSALELRQGRATLRRAPLDIGPDTTVTAPDGRTWRVVRPMGERTIEEKERSPALVIPEWMYVARGEAIPQASERRVAGGLGEYVIRLNDGTEIYTHPSAGPFTDQVKPGAFMARGADVAAIFDAVGKDTPVYIF